MASVVLKNLTKKFKNITAVNSMNLEIKDREFLVLVGPSGCGKTTALRMVAGLEEVTEGEIYIDGKLVNDVPPKDRDIAMVFQNYALYPHMNVYENISFGLKMRKTPKKEIERRVKETAEILGISHLLSRKPKELSGGQRQRVALGRAIVREPKVFLMDEPLSNLDAKLRVQTRAELSKLHRRLGITTIYVTHDQVEAMTMGERIVLMKDGIVQQVDTPLNLYGKPKNIFAAGFIGSPAMNFLDCTLAKKEGDLFLYLQEFTLRLPSEFSKILENYIGQELVLGVRPEHIFAGSAISSTENIIATTVDVIEPMGSDIILYLSKGKHNLIARMDPKFTPKLGEEFKIGIDLNKIHIFDKKTEKAVI